VRLGLFVGEFFADLDAGIPYVENATVSEREAILGQAFEPAKARAAFRREILTTPGVFRDSGARTRVRRRRARLSVTYRRAHRVGRHAARHARCRSSDAGPVRTCHHRLLRAVVPGAPRHRQPAHLGHISPTLDLSDRSYEGQLIAIVLEQVMLQWEMGEEATGFLDPDKAVDAASMRCAC
jgi:hypothetical protein